jgi:biofilm PGA synthesis N-glycosyltransferase PgaC
MFWVAIVLLFVPLYTYGIYPILLRLIAFGFPHKEEEENGEYAPFISIIIPAYNEAGILQEKINNTLACEWPSLKKQIIVITDGSDDGSETMVFPAEVMHMHTPKRLGKSAAINRAMANVQGEIVVITDANTSLNLLALKALIRPFQNLSIGGVSGEKRVISLKNKGAVSSEGLYWRFESSLKRYESACYSLTGAPGELFAFRKSCFSPIPENTILDDLYLSLKIVQTGKTLKYAEGAIASEENSPSLSDEFSRKTRIAAGTLQILPEWVSIMNLRFQLMFISHRVFRWFLAPLALLALGILTPFFLMNEGGLFSFGIVQCVLYLWILGGALLSGRRSPFPGFFVPFYFIMMHLAQPIGWYRYVLGKQQVTWKKINR